MNILLILDCGFRFNKNDVMEMDFQAYLASSSDDDDDDHHDDHPSHNVNMTEEEKIASYRVSTTCNFPGNFTN